MTDAIELAGGAHGGKQFALRACNFASLVVLDDPGDHVLVSGGANGKSVTHVLGNWAETGWPLPPNDGQERYYRTARTRSGRTLFAIHDIAERWRAEDREKGQMKA